MTRQYPNLNDMIIIFFIIIIAVGVFIIVVIDVPIIIIPNVMFSCRGRRWVIIIIRDIVMIYGLICCSHAIYSVTYSYSVNPISAFGESKPDK